MTKDLAQQLRTDRAFGTRIRKMVFHKLIDFENQLLDRKWEQDARRMKLAKTVDKMVSEFEKYDIDDFDFWVFLKYREGKMRSKNAVNKTLEPVILADVMKNGIKLPDNTTMVEIDIKPVLIKGYDRMVMPDSIYRLEFGLGDGQYLTREQLKRRYGLKHNDFLYEVADLNENSKILKFYSTKKKKVSAKKEESVLSL